MLKETCIKKFRGIDPPKHTLHRQALYKMKFRLVIRGCCHSDLSTASTRDEVYAMLAQHLVQRLATICPPQRYMVGVVGGPGSGKSTLSNAVCTLLNSKVNSVATNIPMDGYHYYKHQLDQMPNPSEAYARRGAHWTFDGHAYVSCLRDLKQGLPRAAPSFDHGVGDPVEGAILVSSHQQLIISEGNYLLLDIEPWSDLSSVFDETWYIECPADVAMSRVFSRQTSNGASGEEARGRIDGNDLPNFHLIETTKHKASLIIPFI